eukprot:2762139-Alexandrium_andersonii.AAC.1
MDEPGSLVPADVPRRGWAHHVATLHSVGVLDASAAPGGVGVDDLATLSAIRCTRGAAVLGLDDLPLVDGCDLPIDGVGVEDARGQPPEGRI